MKKIKLLLLIACALSVWQMKGQVGISLPPSSIVIPTGNQTLMNQTISGSGGIWYNWINDSSSVSIGISMATQGLQNNLSSAELYAVKSGSLVLLDRDTLMANNIFLFAKNVTANSSLYLKIINMNTGCGTCTPINPIVNLSVLNVAPGCTGYVQPPCEYVKDGGFEFFNIPCNNISIHFNANSNDFAPCFWHLPNFVITEAQDVGSADYFNDCAPATPIGSSANSVSNFVTLGFTSVGANTGNGYAGFYAVSPIGNQREYVSEALALPLVATNTYVIKLNLRLAYTSDAAVSNIKCLLSNALPVQTSVLHITPAPTDQLLNFGAPAVTNKYGWTQLTYTFVASSAFSQITIGNFEDNSNTNFVMLPTASPGTTIAPSYYFLDDVSIRPVTTFTVASQSISLCQNTLQTVTLSVSPPTTGVNYTWVSSPVTASLSTQTGSSVVVSPSVSTTYTISNGLSGCSYSTTAQVIVNPPFNYSSFYPSVNTICPSYSFDIIPAQNMNNSMLAYNLLPTNMVGSSTGFFGVPTYTLGVNTYTVIITDNTNTIPCVTSQTLSIYVNTLTPSYTIAPTTLCAGQTVTLTTDATIYYQSSPLSIDWGDGAGATNYYTQPQTFSYPTVGNYTIIATGYAGGCSSTHTQVIHVTAPSTPTITLTPSFTSSLCIGACRTYTANGALTYTWSTGATTPTVTLCPTVTTTYSLQGTSACGIVGTKTFVVTVYAPQTPITVLANPNPICIGASTSLQASGANSYTWSGAGLGTAQGNNIPITPTVTTTYTVIGNNGICATNTQSAVVTVTVNSASLPTFSIVTPSLTVCANGTGTNTVLFGTSITSTTGLVFTWNPSGVHTPTANISISQSTVVTVTVANSCGVTQTQNVNINYVASTCCTNTTAALNSFTVNSTTINNQTFKIAANQTVTINGSVTYNSCDFLMGTNSAIIALPTSTLNLTSCRLYSCDGMWQGIVLQHNGNQSAQIYVRNTSIEDAYNGINSNYPATVFTLPSIINVNTNSIFNKNYADIVITYNTAYANNSAHPLTVMTSSFTSQASTTSPGSNLKISNYYSPSIRNHSYAGLYTDNAGTITFTYTGGNNNLVKTKDYGLFFKKTNADVWNVDFNSIAQTAASPTAIPTGVAIVSANAPKYLNVKPIGTSTITNCTFNNVNYGIIAVKTPSLDVQRCLFGNPAQALGYGQQDVYTIDVNSLVRINYNTMTETYYPCTVNFSVMPTPATFSMSVSNNTITANGTSTTGVVFTGITINSASSFSTITGGMVVAANTMTVNAGVLANSVPSGLRISGNSISLKYHPAQYRNGIKLANSHKIMVDNNTINGNLTGTVGIFNTINSGILCVASSSCFVQCNNITQVGCGILYNGVNSSNLSGLFKNTLTYPIRRGLMLSNGGIIGTQGSSSQPSYNRWGGSGWLPSVANTDPSQTYVGDGAFITNAINSVLYVSNNATELPSDNRFFAPSNNGNQYGTIFNNTFTTPATGTLTCAPTLTAGYRIGVSPGTDINQRNDDYTLYITRVLPDATVAPEIKWLMQQDMYKTIRQTGTGSNRTVSDFYSSLRGSNFDQFYAIDSLLSVGNTTLASANNDAMRVTNTIEQNQKDYNRLYISGAISSDDYATLTTLANLCPYNNGNAVFQARALLNMVSYASQEYSDSCGMPTNARIGHHNETQATGVNEAVFAKLFPNPNNGNFTLSYDLKQTTEATVTITDITGKLVYENHITNMNFILPINTADLGSGLYFIKLQNNDRLLWTDKVMIAK